MYNKCDAWDGAAQIQAVENNINMILRIGCFNNNPNCLQLERAYACGMCVCVCAISNHMKYSAEIWINNLM